MKRTAYTKKWPAKHLGEMIHFLESQHKDGLNIMNIAEKTGLTPQYVSALFHKDDMKLSRAEKFANDYGYTLKLYFPQKEFKFGPILISQTKRKEYPNAGNLSGLAKYLADSNITIHRFCKENNMSNSILSTAFKNGDIFVSTLYIIVEALGIDFVWSFEKMNHE